MGFILILLWDVKPQSILTRFCSKFGGKKVLQEREKEIRLVSYHRNVKGHVFHWTLLCCSSHSQITRRKRCIRVLSQSSERALSPWAFIKPWPQYLHTWVLMPSLCRILLTLFCSQAAGMSHPQMWQKKAVEDDAMWSAWSSSDPV